MDIYVVTKEFAAPQLGVRLCVLDTIGKFSSKIVCLIGGTEYDNSAFYEWVGLDNSLNYLSFSGTIPDPVSSVVVSGAFPITSGNDFVTVTGAAFGFVPTSVVVVVGKPSGGSDNIFATPREGSATTDGFTADLSAPASSSGYVLNYIVAA